MQPQTNVFTHGSFMYTYTYTKLRVPIERVPTATQVQGDGSAGVRFLEGLVSPPMMGAPCRLYVKTILIELGALENRCRVRKANIQAHPLLRRPVNCSAVQIWHAEGQLQTAAWRGTRQIVCSVWSSGLPGRASVSSHPTQATQGGEHAMPPIAVQKQHRCGGIDNTSAR